MLYKNVATYFCMYNYKLAAPHGILRALVFYLLFLNFFLLKRDLVVFSFSFKKIRRDLLVINKAPYRYKLARHQFTSARFLLMFSFNFLVNAGLFSSARALKKFLRIFSSLDFCFFSLFFFKLSSVVLLQEWLK